MTRLLCLLSLLAAAIAPSAAAEQGQLDASPTLFSVLAALNAAGYDADLASPANHPLRQEIRKAIAARRPAVLDELKFFVSRHRQDDPSAELSKYISFALSSKGPPDFAFQFRDLDLPPDVIPIKDFAPLMARFHKEAGIDELWQKAQPAFDEAIARYHGPVTEAILQINGYLRNTSSGFLGRRFQIYLDLLGAPNQIQVRGYADDYYIVITTSPEPQIDDVRRAYLGYLLEPPAMRNSELILKKRGLIDYAQIAPALPEVYKSDFLLLTTRSLIKAIESRLARPALRQRMVDEALKEGYVLTPHFAEQLPLYEKQDQSMRLYFPELIESIDLKKEERRLERVEFAAAPAVRRAKPAAAPAPPALTPMQQALEEAENLYRDRDLEKAKEAFTRLLSATDEKGVHASSYYGLARIAVLERDPELAERLFRKAIETGPEPQARAWAEVYLGRLSDAAGEREEAIRHYKEALAVEGGSQAAREAAEKGLQQSFQKQDD